MPAEAPYLPVHCQRWTMPTDYAGETWPGYYRAGVGQSRDSDALERSNFRSMLKALGGESDTVIVVREGHWAVGWIEWIAIHQDDETALQEADEILAALSDYPVIDDEDFCALECEEADEVWRTCYDWEERIRYIRANRSQFEFHNWSDMLGCVRGEYFAGYASELLS